MNRSTVRLRRQAAWRRARRRTGVSAGGAERDAAGALKLLIDWGPSAGVRSRSLSGGRVLNLCVDLRVDCLQSSNEIGHRARLPLVDEAAQRVLIGGPDRRVRACHGVGIGEDLPEGGEMRILREHWVGEDRGDPGNVAGPNGELS